MHDELNDKIFTLFSTMRPFQMISVCRDGVHWEPCEFAAFHHNGYPSSVVVTMQFLSGDQSAFFELTGGLRDVLLKMRPLKKNEPKQQEQYRMLF